jgi:hypothetical protein
MHSDTTFEDVVKVIKEKGWLTGYHCVILKDGSIHPFCRWDRYGNHAKGHNLTSLGIAFNGNFETNPLDEYANSNGQYGLMTPSEEQLHAAAKVVALWAFVYNINVISGNTLIPHRQIRDTVCPGSNFPYEQFHEMVTSTYGIWETSTTVQQELQVFKKKPYLYI